MSSFNTEEFEIDKKKLEIIKYRTIHEEKNNVKTKAKSRDAMIETLRSILIEEVNKKY